MKKSAGSKHTKKSSLDFGDANKDTSFSRVFAASLFIALPFLGFLLGFNYQNELNEMYSACLSTASTISSVVR